MNWWAHLFGLDNASGPAYLAWSGVISDLPEILTTLAALAALALVAIHLNCHQPGCRHIGRYHVAGGAWRVCGKHHPGGPPTAERIARDHHAHLNRIGASHDHAEHSGR